MLCFNLVSHSQVDEHCFGVFLFEGDLVQNGVVHGSLVLGVLDRILLEDFVRLRLEVVHERLQRELQEILVALGKLQQWIGFLSNL